MDHMTHDAHGQVADPYAGQKMSEVHASHDRHAGHSAAMFRDKFWLSLNHRKIKTVAANCRDQALHGTIWNVSSSTFNIPKP